jgi:hypothetical protein
MLTLVATDAIAGLPSQKAAPGSLRSLLAGESGWEVTAAQLNVTPQIDASFM